MQSLRSCSGLQAASSFPQLVRRLTEISTKMNKATILRAAQLCKSSYDPGSGSTPGRYCRVNQFWLSLYLGSRNQGLALL